MKKHIILVILLGCLLSLSQMSSATWEMLEDLTITKPQNYLTTIPNRVVRWGLSGLGGIGGYYGTKKLCNYFQSFQCTVPRINMPLVPSLGAVGSTLLTYYIITESMLQSFETTTMKTFIADWPKKRIVTPEKVRPLLDALYDLHTQKAASLDEEALHTCRSVRLAVYNQFPEKYKHITNANDTTIRVFNKKINWNFDLGSTLTGIANILKIFYVPNRA